MAKSILIIEDEADFIQTLEYNLQKEGYHTAAATSGQAGLRQATKGSAPDLILLDIMLPDTSGTEVCRELRRHDKTRAVPVIMLTAKGEEIDRVVGFEVGADDYLVKPFSVRELLLRIRAILRRTKDPQPRSSAIEFGALRIDGEGHRVWVQDEELMLTALEFKLLIMLVSRKGRVQSREQLLEDVWGIMADITSRTVDTHIKRLRQKLGPAGNYVETIRGVGYRFSEKP